MLCILATRCALSLRGGRECIIGSSVWWRKFNKIRWFCVGRKSATERESFAWQAVGAPFKSVRRRYQEFATYTKLFIVEGSSGCGVRSRKQDQMWLNVKDAQVWRRVTLSNPRVHFVLRCNDPPASIRAVDARNVAGRTAPH